jgi:hypothetical protein
MVQLSPSLLQPLDAHRLRGAQFLREEAHAQLFQELKLRCNKALLIKKPRPTPNNDA